MEATSEAKELVPGEQAVLERRYSIHRPQVLEELIDDELVVINFDTGRYHGVRGAGVEVWRLLDAGFSTGEIATELARRYSGVDAGGISAVTRFVAELENQRLIVGRGAGEPQPNDEPDEHDARTLKPFVPPELDSRDDLADYLALDPIHDVDERGWPNTRR